MRIFLYLAREIYTGFFAVLTILLFIFLSGRFVKHLASAAAGQFPNDIIFSIMLFRLPEFLEILLPLSLFLGLMLAYGRLYVESEMIVLHACGVSKRRLLAYTLWAVTPVFILFALITLYLSPLGLWHYQKLWENPENKMSFSTLVSGNFKKLGNKGLTLYAGEMSQDKTIIHDVFTVFAGKHQDQGIHLIKGKTAQLTYDKAGNQYLELTQGTRLTGGTNGLDFTHIRFNKLGRLMEQREAAQATEMTLSAMPTTQLFNETSTEAKAKLSWRFGLPWMVLIVAIIGLAFSETNHRRGRYIKLVPSIILYFIYFGAITAIFNHMQKGSWPTSIGLWPAHFLFLSIGLLAFYFPEVSWYIRRKKA